MPTRLYAWTRSVPLLLIALTVSAHRMMAQQASQGADIQTLNKQVAKQQKEILQLKAELKKLLKPAAQKQAKRQKTAQSSQDATPPESKTQEQGQQNSLPITFGGDVYLFQYVPLAPEGAQPRFELYAFSALIDGHHGKWGFHADYRFRTTKLRSYYPGNTWLEQGYVSYQTPLGKIKAGSFFRRVGLFWDDSFFGNIQYFDGLKLDPEFGVGFEGAHHLQGRLSADYSLQYFSTDAGVNGSLPLRDFVSEPTAHVKNDVTMRFAPKWTFGPRASVNFGASFATGAIDRLSGTQISTAIPGSAQPATFNLPASHNQRTQVAADATLKIGDWRIYGEALKQTVSGQIAQPPLNATYTLAGTEFTHGRIQTRVNFSQGIYDGVNSVPAPPAVIAEEYYLNARREYIIQPGVTIRLAHGFSFIYEYDYWKSISPIGSFLADKSLNFVLHYHF